MPSIAELNTYLAQESEKLKKVPGKSGAITG